MLRSLVLAGAVMVLMASLPGCDSSSAGECHRRVVERAGCCPACDAECRATITRECGDLHDAPLPAAEVEVEPSTSSSSDGGSNHDEPQPL